MKKYLIFDLDGTLITSTTQIIDEILKYVNEVNSDYVDSMRYTLETTQGMSLFQQFETVFQDSTLAEQYTRNLYSRLNRFRGKYSFYPGVIQKIKTLSTDYKLYLSTGSSTKFALETLISGGIDGCFEMILGSDTIFKGPEHHKLFQENSGDPDFYLNTYSIGDGEMDKHFAQKSGIDFIRVGLLGKDEREIESVVDIDKFL